MFDVILVLVVIVLMLFALYRNVWPPALVFLLAVIIFFFFDIIEVGEIIHGAANENVILIFLLLVTSDIVKKTAVLDRSINVFLKTKLSLRNFFFRLTSLVAFFSAWVNNTPLVAFMIPYVYNWAKKKNLNPSKVMIPLSYAAIMGGTITLIGTSTNLVVNGLGIEVGLKSLNIFDFTWVGLPLTILGIIYLSLFGNKMLPERQNIITDFSEKSRDYLVETIIPPMSKITGKSIEEAQLRNVPGLYLAQIIREEEIIAPVSPKTILHKNDRLFFAGDTNKILDLVERNKNLILPFGNKMMYQNENNIVEVIITNHSRLHLKTAKSSNFRKKYDAAIIAIQRNGETLSGKIGEIQLMSGDLLLLVAGPDFNNLVENEQDFFLTTRIKKIETIPEWKITLFFATLLGAFTLAFTGVMPLFIGLLIVIAITAFTKLAKFEDIKKSLDLNLFLILVLALALGKAIFNSGAAAVFAEKLIGLFKDNTIGMLITIYVVTNITSMFVTNAAAVAITFPVGFALASKLGIQDFTPFLLAIAIAGSAEFITPFGYQTNLMVYGPGGYKFRDYVKVGFPLSIIYLIVTITILGLRYDLFR